MKHIVIVEDELELAGLMRDYLQQAGYRVTLYHHGLQAFTALKQELPDLVVLDLMLPAMDGLVICRELRRISNVPIVMVTARSEEVDRLLGLEIGADDYLCKPFSPRELVARVRAIFRRSQPEPKVRPIDIDEAQQRALIYGHLVNLTPTEFRILALMSRHAGQVYSRARLLDEANPDNLDVADRVIDSHIKNLRKKLHDAAPQYQHDWVQSVYGVGYRFEWPSDD